MKCHAVQTKITESLAAGTPELPEEIALHRGHCPECQAFDHAQRELFASLDAEMQRLVNQPVPPSLLPRVRAGLEQQSIPRAFWTSSWGFVALAASVILALSVAASWNFSTRRNPVTDRASVPQPEPIVSGDMHSPVPIRSTAHEFAKPARSIRGHKTASTPPAPSTDATPKIIVLAEEQQAFARFVADQPILHGMTVPLSPAVVAQEQQPIEAALLQIKDVDVTPLDSTNQQMGNRYWQFSAAR